MPNSEARYPCPVCLGVRMSKLQVSHEVDLLLDVCSRCDGIWFDSGEVQQLRSCRPHVLRSQIELREAAYRMTCHACQAKIDRNASVCPICGWDNVIDCPVCSQPLQPLEYKGLRLDICKACKGVWFDQIELSQIWNLQLAAFANKHGRQSSADSSTADEHASFFLEVLGYSPDIALYGAEVMVETGRTLIDVSGDVLSQSPETAASIVEGTGELAAGVFETIANIIGEVLS